MYTCRRTTPAAEHHSSPPADPLVYRKNKKLASPVAAVVDVPCTNIPRQHTASNRPATKPGATQAQRHRLLSERCRSTGNADPNRAEHQQPMIRFEESGRHVELRGPEGPSWDACDMVLEGSERHSNMHGSISLAGSALTAEDVESSVHNDNMSVFMHGDTYKDDVGVPVTQRISACGGIKARQGARHRSKGQEERLMFRYDAGLRMAMALQAESQGGTLPQVAVRGSVKLQRSKAFVTDCKAHSRLMAWRAT